MATLMLLACAGSTNAATLNVPGDFGTIAGAVAAAQNGDVILVAPGSYLDFIDLQNKSVTIRSTDGPAVTFFEGFGAAVGPFIFDTTGTTDSVIEGFTFRDSGNPTGPGGAIQIVGGTLTVKNCVFDNLSATEGGAIFAFGGATLTVTDCTFINNSATVGGALYIFRDSTGDITGSHFENNSVTGDDPVSVQGGAIYAAAPANTDIEACSFVNNSAEGRGGAVKLGSGVHNITSSTFVGNTSGRNGGALDIGSSVLTLTNLGFTENAAGENGGGIYITSSTGSIDGVELTMNHAEQRGGGIAVSGFGGGIERLTAHMNSAGDVGGGANLTGFDAALRDSTFTENFATNRGGGFALSGLGPATIVTRVVVADNDANGRGGGIYLSSGFEELSYITITGNTAGDDGGGIYGVPRLFANSLIAGNTSAADGGGLYSSGVSDAVVMNLTVTGNAAGRAQTAYFSSTSNTFINNSTFWSGEAQTQIDGSLGGLFVNFSLVEGGYAGNQNVDADPRFRDAANGDFRLLPTSPAIDQGNSQSPAATAFDVDLDGGGRFIDDPNTADGGRGDAPIIDLGAYEFDPGVQQPCPGDADGDGAVGTSDLLIVLANWGQATAGGPVDGDFDESGTVGTSDLLILLANWGATCP